MRYEKGHKDATRRHLLQVASRLFRRGGINAVGVAGLMSEAGLTNGAFYAHFPSKEDLVRESVREDLAAQREWFTESSAGPGGIEGVVRSYLSAAHRDAPAEGCPSAALLDELSRRPAETRDVYTDGLLSVLDVLCAWLRPDDPAAARADALVVFGLLVGTLQLTRTVTDPALADAALARGADAALTLLAQMKAP